MATNTYVPLYTTTLASAASSVTISSISSAYTDLVLVASIFNSGTAANAVLYRVGTGSLNTATNYSTTFLEGSGTSATSERTTSQTYAYVTGNGIATNTTTPNLAIINFQNYANTTTNKTFLSRFSGPSGSEVNATVSLWRQTTAIDTIQIYLSGSVNFAAGTTVSLYGIAAATAQTNTAKATGGTISYGMGYAYHAFTSSGTFTPTQSLTADILVIAGGGGGGSSAGAGYYAAGGGAGGLVGYINQSLTTTGYTVTVGAGGSGSSAAAKGGNGVNSQFASLTASVGGGGGGGGGDSILANIDGNTGGSGGGANSTRGTNGSGTIGQGNNGGAGNGTWQVTVQSGGGGGGAGGLGGNAPANDTGGAGGIGSALYSDWGLVTSTGQNVNGTRYFAGGAGGNGNTSGGAGGYGGGGAGGINSGNAGTANTGGGGSATQAGGSGLVIVRYAI